MSLIHWWPLNGDTNDYGTNPIHGTIIGTASVTSTNGKIGKCLSAGTGSQITAGVSVPTNLVNELSGSDYSFSVWVKPKGTHVHYNGTFISSGNWNNKCWAFGISQNNDKVDVACNGYNKYINYSFTVGNWYNIISVQKGTTNTVYVNGVLVGTTTQTAIYQSDASNLCIGRETYANGYFSFNGNINDVRIYDHALSLKEIKDISKCLIVHYSLNFEDKMNLDGTYPSSALTWDSVDNSGYQGTTGYHNITINSTDTIIGKASAKFNGSSSYIEKFIPGNSPAYTYAVWAKFDATGTYHLCDCRNYANTQGCQPFYGGLSYGIQFYSTNGGSLQPNAATCGWSSSDTNKWFFIVGVLTTTGCKIYINGQLKASNTSTKSNPTVWGDLPLRIGTRLNGQYWFNGKVGDVKVYLSELSADDVLELYERKAAIDSNGNLYANDFIEESNSNSKIYKKSIIKSNSFTEGQSNTSIDENGILVNQIIEN